MLRVSFILVLLVVVVAGCMIPVVGNSPEEIKHRQRMEGDHLDGFYSTNSFDAGYTITMPRDRGGGHAALLIEELGNVETVMVFPAPEDRTSVYVWRGVVFLNCRAPEIPTGKPAVLVRWPSGEQELQCDGQHYHDVEFVPD